MRGATPGPKRGRQRATALVAIVALLALGLPRAVWAQDSTVPGGTFVDDDGTVHEGNIEAIAAEEITRGCDPSLNIHYCPDRPVSRGEMAAFLVRALNLPSSDTNRFTDDNGSIFEADINALAQADITKGCNPPDNTLFCPNRAVTRAEMASFLARGLGLNPIVPDPRPVLVPGALWSARLVAPNRPNDAHGPVKVAFYDRGVVLVDYQQVDTPDLTIINSPVYAFEPISGVWTPTLLERSNPAANEEFPVGLAASGDRIAITAGGDSPAVYVFTRTGSGWEDVRVPLPYADGFGGEVAMDGDRIAVRWNATSFVVLDWNGTAWVPGLHQIDQAVPTSGGPIDVAGDVIALGSPETDRAFVATRGGGDWATSELPRIGVGHVFGATVAADQGRVLVGANGASPGPGGPGGMYLYTRHGSSWTGQVVAEDGEGFGDYAHLQGNVMAASGSHGTGGTFWFFEEGTSGWSGQELTVDIGREWINGLDLERRMVAVVDPGGSLQPGSVILSEVK